MTTEHKYQCNACGTGTVTLVEIAVKGSDFVTVRAKNCDVCKKAYGIKAISRLTLKS